MIFQRPHCVILGAGLAGSAAACALLPTHRVTLVDPCGSQDRPFRIGESVPAAAGRILRKLNFHDQFLSQGHLLTERKYSRWGTEELEVRDAFLNPDGPDFAVDRMKLENGFLKEALHRGASHIPARLRTATAATDCWNLEFSDKTELRADWVIDATGRNAAFARLAGEKRIRDDKLVARWCQGAASGTISGSYLQSGETGWWYTAAVPDHGRVLAFFSDPEAPLPEYGKIRALRSWLARDGFRPISAMKKTAAHGQSLTNPCGWRWHAVGDASLAFDPLSSQGIFHALYTGLKSPMTIASGGETYGAEIAAIYHAYRDRSRLCYSLETRWPDSPFWAVRQCHPLPIHS